MIALAEGGVRETVTEGETGAFYDVATVDALCEVVERFDPLAIDPAACVANAARFDVARFQASMQRVADAAIAGERPPKNIRQRPRRARGLALSA